MVRVQPWNVRDAVGRSGRRRDLPVVTIAVLLALALRLPHLCAPAGPDEAGFLQVAGQWSAGGGSLYGRYWVDRPPLLITLHEVAAMAGGLVPLRLIGCVAVAVTVLASARAASAVGGRAAGRWTAVVAAAFLVAPQIGAQEVNGELLAAPFVALGVLALVGIVDAPDSRAATRRAVAAGVAATCAVLVKQKIVDVVVFAAVLGLAGWRSGGSSVRLRSAACGFMAGSAVAAAAVGGWAALRGTSLPATWDAMYAFRVQAGRVVAGDEGRAYAEARALGLGAEWLRSGLALMTAAVVANVRRWRHEPVMVALAATVAFDLVSVALGGGYWRHYLVQMVVPLSIGTGVLAARASRAARWAAIVAACLTTVGACGAAVAVPAAPPAAVVGAAVARSSEPGDTLTTLYGDPRVNLSAGLPSPYPHLWSLPIRTRDPHLAQLRAVLAGRRAPTWLVVLREVSSWGLRTHRVAGLVEARYHAVTECAGIRVYLRDRVSRPPPACAALGAVFLLPAVEAALFVGLVVPGETAIIVGGALAHAGQVSLWGVILAATAGAVAGDQVSYLAGASYRAVETRLGVGGEIVAALLVIALVVHFWRRRRRQRRA